LGSAHEHATVSGERDRHDGTLVPRKHLKCPATSDVPQANRAVHRGACRSEAVGRERDAGDWSRMTGQIRDLLAKLRIPEARAILATDERARPVRRERDAQDVATAAGDDAQRLVLLRSPHENAALPPSPPQARPPAP